MERSNHTQMTTLLPLIMKSIIARGIAVAFGLAIGKLGHTLMNNALGKIFLGVNDWLGPFSCVLALSSRTVVHHPSKTHPVAQQSY